jgi:acetolactate synthase-1/2/3 large subunit
MKVAEYIIDFFHKNGVDAIFGHIGGFNANMLDSLSKTKKLKFVLGYHEQASGFGANAFALIKDQVGVATTSGAPSFCNIVPGIVNAYFDSIPCIFVHGSPHSEYLRSSKEIRQNLFEEMDAVHMVSDVTKFAVKLTDPKDIRYYLEKALHISQNGRKGPVLLDIPYNIAKTDVNLEELHGYIPIQENYDNIDTDKILEIIKKSKMPLILAGGGARSEVSKKNLKILLDKVKIPVVASLLGLDVLHHDNECFIGFIGHYGNRYANFAIANCDCLIVLGSRLDERQIAGHKNKFAPNAKIIRVDIDRIELGRVIPENISIYSTVENFLQKIINCNFDNCNFDNWLQLINQWKERYPSYNLASKEIEANNFLRIISDYLSNDTIICSDVGQNQMSVAQAIYLKGNQKLLNCGGYGSMGFSLPAAIGASYANPNSIVISINGDGGIQMNIQELQTIKRDNLPINIIILNNNCLGMIRRLQEKMYDNRTEFTVANYTAPNYQAIASAYGFKYLKIYSVEQYGFVKNFIGKEPCIIEVMLSKEMQNNPEPGVSIDMQTPLLLDKENQRIKNEIYDKIL